MSETTPVPGERIRFVSEQVLEAEYEDRDRVSQGGGEVNEGEEIETLETDLDEAMRMIDSGAIQDGKTIMLLQYAHRIGLQKLTPQTP
jgi:hypothetical protein